MPVSNDNSHVVVDKEGRATTFSGPDAVNLFAAMALAAALKMYATARIIPTRGVTITVMLKQATKLTGKQYGRGKAMTAAEDVKKWVDTMKAAIPIVKRED